MHLAADFIAEAAKLGLQPGLGDERLWLGHVKAFADGTMGSHTAAMLQPFENEPDNTGIMVTGAEELWQLAVSAGQAGFPLCIHAIGDLAVRQVLDVFHEHLATPNGKSLLLPHRIEHVQIIHPDDIARLGHPGIVTSMQPYHLMTDWQTAVAVWGERTQTSFAFQAMLDAGATLAFGSDGPVAPMDPWAGLYAAVARQDLAQQPAGGWYPEQRISLAQAIWAYTMGGATVAGKTAVQGSISPNKWADFIVLDRNLFEITPTEILKTQVDLTVFASQVVYSRTQ
jgi:predicted amidohydrolase YtcJ